MKYGTILLLLGALFATANASVMLEAWFNFLDRQSLGAFKEVLVFQLWGWFGPLFAGATRVVAYW